MLLSDFPVKVRPLPVPGRPLPRVASTRVQLSAAVAEICRRLSGQVGGRTAAGLGPVAARLVAPLQLAVAGRVSSGKSTLVNALIGRRVAPTDVGETTRLVTRFSYGTIDRVEVVRHGGGRAALPFDADGMIPRELGADLPAVSHLDAYLTNDVLRDLTVIDTPGLASADSGSDSGSDSGRGSTEAVLAGRLDPASAAAVAGAEALLYVLAGTARADDAEVLATFTAATAGREPGPANAIAVLTKADTVPPESVPGAEGDVRSAARILADRQAEALGARVAGVLPVIGLLAETAETGRFTTDDADALHTLAGTEPATRQAMLLSADLFTTLDAPVPPATRARLLERLDLHGIGRALAAIDADPGIGAGGLRATLFDASGLAALRRRLNAVLRSRADTIKATAALGSLAALARDSHPADRQQVHDAVEELLRRPEAHALRLAEVLTLVSSGAVALPADLAAEVLRVGGSTAAAEQLGMPGRPRVELAEHALERAGWWRSFSSFCATPAQARVAHVVHRAYFLLWQQLHDPSGASALR